MKDKIINVLFSLFLLIGVQNLSTGQVLTDSSENINNSLIQTALEHKEIYVFINVSTDTLKDMYLIKNDFITANRIFRSPFGTQIIQIDSNNIEAFTTSTIEIVSLKKSVDSNTYKIQIYFYIAKHLATINYFTYEYSPSENIWLLRKYRKVQT